MPYYLTHPEHGVHICYTLEDVEAHKLIGWSEKPAISEPTVQIGQERKKPGRPKVKHGYNNVQ